jgi:hypothetical protein
MPPSLVISKRSKNMNSFQESILNYIYYIIQNTLSEGMEMNLMSCEFTLDPRDFWMCKNRVFVDVAFLFGKYH